MSKFERKFKNGDVVLVKSSKKVGTISGYSDGKYSVRVHAGGIQMFSTKELDFYKSDFKIGDKVKITADPDPTDNGKIGTIVGKCKYNKDFWTIKIPGYKGHSGDIEDGSEDKWWIDFHNLEKIEEPKTEGNSMKIELKKTEKKVKEITYPCFKKGLDHDSVVLFFNETSGITVQGNSGSFRSNRDPKRYGSPLEGYSVTFTSVP